MSRGTGFVKNRRVGFGVRHLPYSRETGQNRCWMGRSWCNTWTLGHSDPSAGGLVHPRPPGSVRILIDVRDTRLNRTASRSIVSHDYSRVSRSIRGPARDFRGRRSLNRGYIRARGDRGPWVTEGTAQIHRCADENRVYLHQGTCGRVDG